MDKMDIGPQNKEFYEKGLLALRKKNYAYALELFQLILRECPEFSECRHQLWTTARKQAAESRFSILGSLRKISLLLILYLKLSARILTNQAAKAVPLCEEIILLTPNNTTAYRRLATLFLKDGQISNSLRTLEEIIFIDRNNLRALKLLAPLYLQEKDYPRAKKAAQRILEISPNSMEAQNILKDIAALNAIEKGFDEIKPAS